jgi:hypothetical protein
MSVLFKTLERLVPWHIEETNLIDRPMHKSQYGFRKGKSTDQALSKAVNIIEKGLNQGKYVLGVFFNISGAFDNVLHSSITSARRRRGIDNMTINWYDHFLKSRTVKSTLGGTEALIRPGKGAPQGGVLSAIILWNLVFDDFLKMYDNSAIKSISFADDGTLLITGICINTIYNIMQKVLQHAENWAAENGLKILPQENERYIIYKEAYKH